MKYGEIGCSLSHYFIWKDVSISMHVSFPEEGRTSKHSEKKVVTTNYLTKFQSPRVIAQPKIIGPEQNVNLIYNLSL
jgi:hypothetical protein